MYLNQVPSMVNTMVNTMVNPMINTIKCLINIITMKLQTGAPTRRGRRRIGRAAGFLDVLRVGDVGD